MPLRRSQSLAGVITLLATSGCFIFEGGRHERRHGHEPLEGPPAVIVRPPVIELRPPEIIVR